VEVRPGSPTVVTFVNQREPSLIVEKVDSNGNPLAGAHFEVRTLAGARVAQGVTNAGGMWAVTGLATGSYEIIETRAPEGFLITEPSRPIEIRGGQTRTERFVNHRQPTLTIEKVDENGRALPIKLT